MARKTNVKKQKKDNSLRNAIIAFGVSLLGYAALPFTRFHKLSHFLLGGGIALVIAGIVKVMTTPMKGLDAPKTSDGIVPENVQDEYARTTVVTGLELLEALRKERDAISEYVFTRRINDFADSYTNLLNRVVADHDKATYLRKLNSYYVPTAIKLLEGYRDAKGQDTSYMEISATREDILKTLDQLIEATKTLKKKMVKSNLETIDIKIEVLEDILRADGYIEDEETGDLRQSAEKAAAQIPLVQQMRGSAAQAAPVRQPAPAKQPQPVQKAAPVQASAERPVLKANVPTASAQQLEKGAPVLHVPGLLTEDAPASEAEERIHL